MVPFSMISSPFDLRFFDLFDERTREESLSWEEPMVQINVLWRKKSQGLLEKRFLWRHLSYVLDFQWSKHQTAVRNDI